MLKKFKSKAEDWVSNHNKRLSEGKSLKRLTMCKKCYTFYYKNSWHFEKPEYLNQEREEEIPVRFTECPACLEQEMASYEMESNSNFALGMG